MNFVIKQNKTHPKSYKTVPECTVTTQHSLFTPSQYRHVFFHHYWNSAYRQVMLRGGPFFPMLLLETRRLWLLSAITAAQATLNRHILHIPMLRFFFVFFSTVIPIWQKTVIKNARSCRGSANGFGGVELHLALGYRLRLPIVSFAWRKL